jgi:hypothetical protein
MSPSHIVYAISSLVTSKLGTFIGGIDPSLNLAINAGIHELFGGLTVETVKEYLPQLKYIIVIALIVFGLYKKSEMFISFFKTQDEVFIHDIDIEDKEGLSMITDYVFSRSDIFCGLRYHRRSDERCWLKPEMDITFSDNGTKGRLSTKEYPREAIEKDHKTVTQIFCITLTIEPNETYNDARAYFSHIVKTMEEYKGQNPTLSLKYAKQIGKDEWFDQVYYTGDKSDNGARRKKFMDSFFHQQKEKIWNYCKAVQDTPNVFYDVGQAPYGNFLLYGPPGTGKSSLVYRLGMSLGRHIVSVDLSNMSKYDAYWAIRQPSIDGERYEPSECIILLEEFDIAIDKLSAKSMEVNKTMSMVDWFNIKSPIGKKERKECECDEDDCDVCKKKEKKDSIWSSMKQEFTVEDLLELLQGPVPSDRSLIFATTNKYKEISQTCPALFRPGRLTPINFDHLSAEAFRDLCIYHFGEEMPNITGTIPISTASIIGMVMTAKTSNVHGASAFAHFQRLYAEELYKK